MYVCMYGFRSKMVFVLDLKAYPNSVEGASYTREVLVWNLFAEFFSIPSFCIVKNSSRSVWRGSNLKWKRRWRKVSGVGGGKGWRGWGWVMTFAMDSGKWDGDAVPERVDSFPEIGILNSQGLPGRLMHHVRLMDGCSSVGAERWNSARLTSFLVARFLFWLR